MTETTKQKKRPNTGCVPAVLLLALIPALCVAWFVWPTVSMRHFMLSKVNHPQLARACLDLITNADYKSLQDRPLDRRHTAEATEMKKLPEAIRQINPRSVWCDNDSVMIVMTRDIGFTFFPKPGESRIYELKYVPYLPGGKRNRLLFTINRENEAEPTGGGSGIPTPHR